MNMVLKAIIATPVKEKAIPWISLTTTRAFTVFTLARQSMQIIVTVLAMSIIVFLLNLSAVLPANGRRMSAETDSREAMVVAIVSGAPRLSANLVMNGVTMYDAEWIKVLSTRIMI